MSEGPSPNRTRRPVTPRSPAILPASRAVLSRNARGSHDRSRLGSADRLRVGDGLRPSRKGGGADLQTSPGANGLDHPDGQLARLRRQSLDAAADEATCFAEFTRESSTTNAPVLAQAERGTALSLTERAIELTDQLELAVDASGQGDLTRPREPR